MTVTPEQYTGPTEFVHLHNHTIFSPLDGVADPKQYAQECKKRGYPAMSATEHGNVASIPDMYLEFKKAGVKFVAGCELYYNNYHREASAAKSAGMSPQKANASDDPAYWEDFIRFFRSRHLTVLAKNEVGYNNLLRLTTDANRDGSWRANRPGRLWFDKLANYRDGLIVLSGCLNGPVAHELHRRRVIKSEVTHGGKTYHRVKEAGEPLPKRQRLEAAYQQMRQFRRVFREDYWVELQMPLIREDPAVFEHGLLDLEVFELSLEMADYLRIPVVLTNDVHYMTKQDHMLQKLLMAIDQDVTVDSPDLFGSGSGEQYMKTRAELWATWRNHPYHRKFDDGLFERMCDNTLEVASRCQHLKIDATPKIPKIVDADSQLRQQVYRALRDRGLDKCDKRYLIDGRMVTYREQADIELDRFIDKGFASYFLITADLVRYGKSKGYPFSPRGSAGGSLVCFLLDIHVINPLPWQLSFDRFMSPSRGGFMLQVRMPEAA